MNESPNVIIKIIARTVSLATTIMALLVFLVIILMFLTIGIELLDNLLDFLGWEGWRF